ncbi:MAG TPA: archaellin/type IV pilin N-terminal domain-containing protein [Methanoregulaceae archaeon]|nr:archaellin/type IV pilin N-terminal domain-containing protein [Methanoregulaceae archaeon]
MKMSKRNEDAFTGLEAAIVLIAFVVVAAVFSYVVLGAGFFTTQKSQQVVHAGVTQAASNIVVKGNVYGTASTGNAIDKLQFDIGLAAGGLPVDVSKITMTFSTANVTPYNLNYSATSTTTPGSWWVNASSMTSSPLLQEGQFATIIVLPDASLSPRETFDLELKPENGASLGVERTVPAGITNTTLLY